jgi:hypothetical protein
VYPLTAPYRRVCVAALVLLCAAFTLSAGATKSFEHAQVLPSAEIVTATGRTPTEWGNAWWKWAFDNPEVLGDTTGKFGSLGNVPGKSLFRGKLRRRAIQGKRQGSARRIRSSAGRDLHLDVLRSLRRDPLRKADYQREFHQENSQRSGLDRRQTGR